MAETEIEPDPSYIANVTRVRAAAGAILRDQTGRVLLVRPTYKDLWELPGGTVEPDESPAGACNREISEELDLSVPTGALLCVDWVPANPPWDGGLMFLFDGGTLTAQQITTIRPDPNELDHFEFVDPAHLDQMLIPRMARRVTAALAAIGHGGVYLEDGIPVPNG
ncbi:NUDIX domain-containing protein [Micromonospora yangpuensis]|uniref:NUDIX domain-containing protein n=1 Tax=Micromonospora yangpuensis TaxID=683228 RepID=A0A1C6U9F9_9ACTN|nr:NUDIX hydrolase [Micromonospora yangpuensis]GGL88475.1 NUDIX hydrolase [Micromonospora yangpuensis]SCL50656.1 NUDIX domain-containing protein [Micromonospora yangpuensis]